MTDITEVKSVLDAHKSAIDAAMAKYDGQMKEQGDVSVHTQNEVKALSERFDAAIKDIGQKLETTGKKEDMLLSAGAEFIKSEGFKQLASDQTQRARIEVKNTVVSDSTTVFPNQRPGVIGGNFLPLTIRQVIPTIQVSSNSVNSLRELAWTNSAAEASQGAAKAESSLTFEGYDVPIRTVAHWIKVSKQLLRDAPAIAAYIDVRLRDGLAQRIDQQLYKGNGTSPNISGLTDSGNYTAFTATTGANLLDSINKAKYALWATGNMPDVVIVNPADWGAMEITKAAVTGEYLYGTAGTQAQMTPFGVRVVLSNHVTSGYFLMGAIAANCTIYQNEGAVVEMGYVSDDFTKNLITIRCEERLGLGIDKPAAILYGAH